MNFSPAKKAKKGLALFFALFAAHLLSAFPLLPLMARQWIWLAGFAAVWLWGRGCLGEGKSGTLGEKGPVFHPWGWWAAIGFCALLMRGLRFLVSDAWPNFDETETTQLAIQLSRHWEWKFFYAVGQVPTLFAYLESFLFRASNAYFFNLFFLPAALSALTVLLGYQAAKLFFGGETAFFATAFLALGYWPAFTGNFCVPAILLPFWECAAFVLLCLLLKAPPQEKKAWALALGLWTGFGFWTYLAWPVVALAIVSAVLFSSMGLPRPSGLKALFTSAFLLALSPYAYAALREDSFHHLAGFSVFNGWFSPGQRFQNALDYLNCLFWGFWSPKTLNVPVGGGLLNPLTASFFAVGLRELWLRRAQPASRWMIFSIPLFLMPGILTQNLQFLRIDQVFPLVFVLSAWGLGKFLSLFTHTRARLTAVLLVLLAGGIWDIARLAQGFKDDEMRSGTFRYAYGILKNLTVQRGGGLSFLAFGSQPLDADPEVQGLQAVLSPVNGVEKEGSDGTGIRWAAVITNAHFEPFLRRRFPQFAWRRLPYEEDRWDGGLVLGLAPLDGAGALDPGALQPWIGADKWFRRVSLEADDVCNGPTYQRAQEDLLRPGPDILTDPFLASCYWEKLSDFYYLNVSGGNYDRVVECLQKAIDSGYPAGNLYYKLGSLLLRKHRYAEAKKAFQNAMRAPDNSTPAQQGLELLSQLESKGTPLSR